MRWEIRNSIDDRELKVESEVANALRSSQRLGAFPRSTVHQTVERVVRCCLVGGV